MEGGITKKNIGGDFISILFLKPRPVRACKNSLGYIAESKLIWTEKIGIYYRL
nr:MAG TPA: hypothetical protein [Caudoviricetes sp.]